MGKERSFTSPNMSDTTLLVSVEDLINMAMGPEHVNVVNFKMIQTVLHILARQLRMLETQVEIRISEGPPAHKEKHDKKRQSDYSSDSSPSKSPRKGATPLKGIKEEKEKATRDKDKEREIKAATKEKEKAQKATEKEKERAARAESKERDKAERATSKEREKAERAESKEREKGEKMAAKDKEKAERAESKEREKGARAESKERDKAEKAESKDKEKAEKAAIKEKEKMEKMDAKDREKAEKEKEKMEKMSAKDREKAEKEKEKMEKMSAKDREKAEKEKEKMEKMSAKDREKAEKEKEKMEKMSAKEREKAEKEQEKMEKMSAKDREKAEKEQEKMEKMSAKDREKAEKEKEKLEKMDAKEREKAEKEKEKLEKMDAKDRAKAEKEREKLDKMDAKDREKAIKEQEKAEKAAEKEKEKMDKMSAKEKEKYEKELAKQKAKEEKEQAKSGKDKTGISIKEKDKVLVVEKGPTTRSDSRTHVGSIEVVTVSQFELLETIVNDLKEKAGPLPFPALPDNEKLRAQLAQGSASLTDTMQAMQVKARVQAAEAAIGRMAGLLTQLAAAGALPEDVAGTLEDVKAEMEAITVESARPRAVSIVAGAGGGGGGGGGGLGAASRKSVAIDPMSKTASTTSRADARSASMRQSVSIRPSVTSRASAVSKPGSIGQPGVTHVEMDDALRALKDNLTKNMNNLTTKATTAAEGAATVAKAASGKMEVALKLNSRVNTLYSLVSDYAEQLSGFDAGLTTQMQSFQEQMVQMRNDLKGGVNLLESANNNAETAAVMELNERYQGLVSELDHTVHEHVTLTTFQKQLGEELRSLLECVEMLREQKADRDEVLDGLRDKADNSRLAGLLTELEFAASRSELDRRLDLCYEKFAKQEQVWMSCIKDLTDISEGKAEIMQLLAAKEDAQQQLRVIQERLQRLAIILGEPKAAMLTRQLSKGARCGSCQVPALQEPFDACSGKPPLLPCFRPAPVGEEQPCVPEWKPAPPPDDRQHTCHRWVGGSHTLVSESVAREQAGPLQALGPPSRRYTGLGADGRLYMMEEVLQPCEECNMISTDKAPDDSIPGGNVTPVDGGGDIELHLTQTVMELPP